MPGNFARPLLNHEVVIAFLKNCIGMSSAPFTTRGGQSIALNKLTQKIRNAESEMQTTDEQQTLTNSTNRFPEYKSTAARQELREQILAELLALGRLDDDDKIELGRGGAMPKGGPDEARAERQAYVIIGLPASGKSTIVNQAADRLGACIIDTDFAKRKIPEFAGTPAGANLVHSEARELTFGDRSLFSYCLDEGINVVVPKIGDDYQSIVNIRDNLKKRGYSVHLTATVLTREKATLRALNRFVDTERYVPLGLIFDTYANDPIMNYYRFRCEEFKNPGTWISMGAVDSSNGNAECIDFTDENNPAYLTCAGAKL